MFASDYRELARTCLKGNWWMAALATFLASLLGGVSVGSGQINLNIDERHSAMAGKVPAEVWALAIALTLVVVLVAFVAAAFVGGVVGMGYSRIILNLTDFQAPDIGTLFCRFQKGKYITTVKLIALRGACILGLMLLLIIPGIIAGYSYAMTDFIMLDHPELTASQCMKASRKLMRGNKWRLFCLEFSFLGWRIAAAFTCGIGNFFLLPYNYTANAHFYRDISAGVNVCDLLDEDGFRGE